jgi:hypothetical protein
LAAQERLERTCSRLRCPVVSSGFRRFQRFGSLLGDDPVHSPRYTWPLLSAGAQACAASAGDRALLGKAAAIRDPDAYTAALQQLLATHGLGAAEILPIDSLTAQKRGERSLPALSYRKRTSQGTSRGRADQSVLSLT